MKYYVHRGGQQYGPYTREELISHMQTGNVSPTDAAWAEGMKDWVPVSSILNDVAAGAPPGSFAQPSTGAYATPAAAGLQGGYPGQAGYSAPILTPPDFHWALVLLLGVFSCGIFYWVWMIVVMNFVRKLENDATPLILAIVGILSNLLAIVIQVAISGQHSSESAGLLLTGTVLSLVRFVCLITAYFMARSSLVRYYNSVEPINLQLGGVATFFLNILYFQYHLSRIARWKKTGILDS